jgi:phosphoglycolate phosphatase-like HAD superfamily hydrolase
MPDQIRSLVLFDIDGTLVQTAGAGVRGMNAAFERMFGPARVLDGIPIAGRTDRAIVMDAMRKAGIESSDETIGAFRQAYVEALHLEIGRPVSGQPFGVLPGVVALLDALETTTSVTTALLTGNFEMGATIKLSHFDLWRRFAFGAFGDDHADRRSLVPIAVERLRALGLPAPPPDRIVIIGDTPSDVDCAKAYGARALAVATGPFSSAALQDAGADVVVETLEAVTPPLREWIAR